MSNEADKIADYLKKGKLPPLSTKANQTHKSGLETSQRDLHNSKNGLQYICESLKQEKKKKK